MRKKEVIGLPTTHETERGPENEKETNVLSYSPVALHLPDLPGRPLAERLGLAGLGPPAGCQQLGDGLHVHQGQDRVAERKAQITGRKKIQLLKSNWKVLECKNRLFSSD